MRHRNSARTLLVFSFSHYRPQIYGTRGATTTIRSRVFSTACFEILPIPRSSHPLCLTLTQTISIELYVEENKALIFGLCYYFLLLYIKNPFRAIFFILQQQPRGFSFTLNTSSLVLGSCLLTNFFQCPSKDPSIGA